MKRPTAFLLPQSKKPKLAAQSRQLPSSKTEELDAPLHAIGFEIEDVSAERVNGRFTVTPSCCQPFKVLHGGVSALVAEALGSIGTHVASGYQRIAGVQLSINHHNPAVVGDVVFAEATPHHAGRIIQVWEVRMWKMNASTSEKGELISSARVTLLANLPVPENAKNAAQILKKYARL